MTGRICRKNSFYSGTGHEIDSAEDGPDERGLALSFAEVVEELAVEYAEREGNAVDDDVNSERAEHHDPAVAAVRGHRQPAIPASSSSALLPHQSDHHFPSSAQRRMSSQRDYAPPFDSRFF